jgi:hypothetical protein
MSALIFRFRQLAMSDAHGAIITMMLTGGNISGIVVALLAARLLDLVQLYAAPGE